jgi:hypothetical protein
LGEERRGDYVPIYIKCGAQAKQTMNDDDKDDEDDDDKDDDDDDDKDQSRSDNKQVTAVWRIEPIRTAHEHRDTDQTNTRVSKKIMISKYYYHPLMIDGDRALWFGLEREGL